MSYSIAVVASTKQAAGAAMVTKLVELAEREPMHARDAGAAVQNAEQALLLLADDPNRDVAISCNGYLKFGGGQVETVCINVSASLISRK